MTSDEIKLLLERCPDAEAYLKRVVKHAAGKTTLPPRIVLGYISSNKTVESTLGKILSNRFSQRMANTSLNCRRKCVHHPTGNHL